MGRHFLIVIACLMARDCALAQGASAFRWSRRSAYSFRDSPTIPQVKGLQIRQRQALLEALGAELAARNPPSEPLAARRRVANATRIRLIDLNGDGKPEAIVRVGDENGGCKELRCSLLIFTWTGSGYRRLWQSDGVEGGDDILLTIRSHRSNGFHDLVFAVPGIDSTMNLQLERYDNGTYDFKKCYSMELVAQRTKRRFLHPPIYPCADCHE